MFLSLLKRFCKKSLLKVEGQQRKLLIMKYRFKHRPLKEIQKPNETSSSKNNKVSLLIHRYLMVLHNTWMKRLKILRKISITRKTNQSLSQSQKGNILSWRRWEKRATPLQLQVVRSICDFFQLIHKQSIHHLRKRLTVLFKNLTKISSKA